MKYLICLTLSLIAMASAGQQFYRYEPAAKWISKPQRMMFMRYVQPHFARSSQAAALVAEDGVAASGAVLQDAEGAFVSELPQYPVESTDEQVSGSEVEIANVANTDETVEPVVENVYVPATEVEETTAKRDSRVYIDLEPTAENEIPRGEQDTNVAVPAPDAFNTDDKETAPKVPALIPRPVARRPTKADGSPAKPIPTGTFFPVDFGNVHGGAIAIAHSLSTDNGGAASSNAIAYGTPGAVEAASFRARRH